MKKQNKRSSGPHDRHKVLILPTADGSELPIDSLLGNEDFDLTLVSGVKDALKVMGRGRIDLVILSPEHLSDTMLRDFLGRRQLRTACLCLGANANDPAPRESEYGFITRSITDHSPDQLVTIVTDILERHDLRRQVMDLRETVAMHYGFDDVVGVSSEIRQLIQGARRVAPTDITVLLQGPAGSGKELLARTIHHHSERCGRPFVVADCSALSELLLNATLWPDATNDGDSMILRAETGTLFLKNIDCLPQSMQSRLGQFVQNLRFDDAPSSKRMDLRLMASCSEDLSSLVNIGRFDRGLCNGLKVVEFLLPSLAERSEDIELLLESFLRRLAFDRGEPVCDITPTAVEKMRQYGWPGNVRELENCLQRAVAVCREKTIDAINISFVGGSGSPEPVRSEDYLQASGHNGSLDDSQRDIIVRTLDDNNWNFTRTASELGIGRTTLWRKVKKYGLSREGVTSHG